MCFYTYILILDHLCVACEQGHRVKSWKFRRFVLSGLRLAYYSGNFKYWIYYCYGNKRIEGKEQKGEFSLKGADAIAAKCGQGIEMSGEVKIQSELQYDLY